MKLIRSDAPNNLSKDEIQWLLQNDITTIIDLRDGDEVKRKPCPLLQNSEFTYFHIPVSGGNIIPKSSDMVSLVYLNLKKMLKDYVACHPEVDIEVITPKKRYIEEFLDNLRL